MANAFEIRVNNEPLNAALGRWAQRIGPEPLLRVAAEQVLTDSKQAIRDQGSPPGIWPPLADSTLARAKPGKKPLIDRGLLFNSNTYTIAPPQAFIGSNLVYARIQHEGGEAGRRPPFKKEGGKRPLIPARPWLTVDREKVHAALQRTIDDAARQAGFETR